jgi:hypothetical protein
MRLVDVSLDDYVDYADVQQLIPITLNSLTNR